jgi:hypothetical protein
MRSLVLCSATLILSGCLSLDPPQGVLACVTSSDCPSGWSCSNARCYRSTGPEAGVATDAGARDAGMRDAAVVTETPDAGADAGPPPRPVVCTTCTAGTTTGCTGGQRCYLDWAYACTFCQAPTGLDAAVGEGCRTSADCRDGASCLRRRCREECDPAGGTCTNPAQHCFDMEATGGTGLCLDSCLPGALNCPDGDTCGLTTSWGGRRSSLCEPSGTTPRYGPCDNRTSFCGPSDYCMRYGTMTVCYPACGSDVFCGPSFDRCLHAVQDVAPTGASVGGCFEICDDSSDCPADFACVPYIEEFGFCAPRCHDDDDCQPGERCDLTAGWCM